MRLAVEPDLLVVGEAADGETALKQAAVLCPDIALIDVDMPHENGLAMANSLHALCPEVAIIILSIHDDDATQAQAVASGAAAFVAKCLPAETLLAKIREVAGFLPGRIY